MRPIQLKSAEEVELIRRSSLLVGKTLGEVSKLITPGVSTLKLDRVAEEFIRDNGGIPAFLNYPSSAPGVPPYGFTLCVSVNGEVVHGMPSEKKVLKDGEIVSVDCGVKMDGFFGDSAYTFAVGNVPAKVKRLLQVTRESLYKGIEQAVEGNFLGDVSQAVQFHAETAGFSVVREMVGHGIGRNLHEPPEVPNYGRRKSGPRLETGMVLAIEPMINLGRRRIDWLDDGWTIVTSDGLPSAHFEHTVAIRPGAADILSTFEYIIEN